MAVTQRGYDGKRKGKRGTSWHASMSPPRHPVTGEKRKRIWVGSYRRRREAVEALNHALAKIEEEDRMKNTITLGEWADEWFRYWKAISMPACSTVQAAISECRKLQEALGDHLLSELRREHIQAYVDQSLEFVVGRDGDPISLKVVRRRLGRLKQILEYAVEKEMIRENPAAVQAPREEV